jgi:hypothetical protein
MHHSAMRKFTANNSTEGAAEKLPIWDVFKELPIILTGFA